MQRQLCALSTGSEQQEQADRRAHRAAYDATGIGQASLAQDAGQNRAVERKRVVKIEGAVRHPQ